ncbi:MAG TPA: tetratricopeptide repeat protein [Pyrinomonadaceae bacterium]|nr:tetratricopeptide repeat protein [Pyrinomonadaceae bacterium]
MKKIKAAAILLIAFALLGFGVISIRSLLRSAPEVTSPAESIKLSKADQRIVRAQQLIEQIPNKAEGYNQLASAYMQKARETSDFAFNASADDAITRSLSVEADNYDALKLRAKLQLTYHRFAEALDTAHRAQRVRKDDNDVWGMITDALVELGDYPAAIDAAQKMIDLKPDSSSFARVSYLRSLHGDTIGAIQAMKAALKASDPNDAEGIAWCHVQLGNELMNSGKLQAAESQFDAALRIFSDHRLATEAKARARTAAGDLQTAVAIYEREQMKNRSADASQALGDLYELLGQKETARTKYEEFEMLERENAVLEKSWRHMLNYWLDHDKNLEESLNLSGREYETRKDIFTCDLVAWAFFKNGHLEEARKMIDEALRTNTKDARINYHAGLIFKALNMRKKAAQHLRLGAALNSSFDPVQAETAKRMLAQL